MRTATQVPSSSLASAASGGSGLADLIGVCGVLALFTFLVWPALAKGNGPSNRTVCEWNIKRIMTAALLYATENNDILPHPSWGSDLTGPDNWCYAIRLGTGQKIPSTFGKRGPYAYTNQLPFYEAGQLARYLPGQRTLICPTDWQESMGAQSYRYSQRVLKLTSYTMNAAVIGYGRLADRRPFKTRDFRLEDSLVWEPDEADPFHFNDAASLPSEGVSQRHNPACGLGIFRGGAVWIPVARFKGLAAETIRNRLWCAPDTQNGH